MDLAEREISLCQAKRAPQIILLWSLVSRQFAERLHALLSQNRRHGVLVLFPPSGLGRLELLQSLLDQPPRRVEARDVLAGQERRRPLGELQRREDRLDAVIIARRQRIDLMIVTRRT